MDNHQLNNKSLPEWAKTLWSSSDKTRHFLIPDALVLPSGEFQLRTAIGRKQNVDPAGLPPFEVSPEEAGAWAKAQLGEVARQLKAGLKETLFGTPEKDQGLDQESKSGETTHPPRSTTGLDLLADITGAPREHLSDDYRAVGLALREYLKDLTETTASALSGDPERERDSRCRMRDWAETLRAHGIPTSKIESLNAAPGNQKGAPDRDVTDGTGV